MKYRMEDYLAKDLVLKRLIADAQTLLKEVN
jgi:hypothetical protein